ncbi:hypothetical protein [Sulfurirhabdus autotrophica]|uniref:Uncharacterized protein n=1 Tax=Sulfurirhabdus autotrophica TaxID=1706046 RepID=A0A4R3YCU3_9PROT|nr:hypothetical protein [Sulfurirhabdus autotrophica]TCV89642.1 hypothetical protein EDC63_102162 [Sulfurirhabdus autotrophica]
MAVPKTTRWILISTALLLTLGAVFWVSNQEESATAKNEFTLSTHAKTTSKKHNDSVESTNVIQLDKLNRSSLDAHADLNDIFKGKSWYVPPPPPKPQPPPPPSAPPLPYTYMGKLIDGGKLSIFLSKQDRNFIIKEGDTLEGMYRVESITPSNITLTYIPLNIKQIMQIGEMN